MNTAFKCYIADAAVFAKKTGTFTMQDETTTLRFDSLISKTGGTCTDVFDCTINEIDTDTTSSTLHDNSVLIADGIIGIKIKAGALATLSGRTRTF